MENKRGLRELKSEDYAASALYFKAVQNLVYRCRNFHSTVVDNIELASSFKPNPSQIALNEQKVYLRITLT